MGRPSLARLFQPARHSYRPKRLCKGNKAYEQAMVEAQAEFDEAVKKGQIPRGQATRQVRAARRLAGVVLPRNPWFLHL